MNNYTHYKAWDKIMYQLSNLNDATNRWSLGIDKKFSSHILLGMWLLIHAGIEVNPCL